VDEFTVFGLFAVTSMLVCHALEDRSGSFLHFGRGVCPRNALWFFRARGLLGLWKPFGAQSRLEMGGSDREVDPVAAYRKTIACTLMAGDFRDRLALIAALNRDALRSYDRAALHCSSDTPCSSGHLTSHRMIELPPVP